MKKTTKLLSLAILALTFAMLLTSCSIGSISNLLPWTDKNTVSADGLWESAKYLRDTKFGTGSKAVILEVKAGEQSVTFTVHTDKSTVGEALLEHEIIEGDSGAYGLYVKKVNGILADYDINQSYWAFYINGEFALTGVDATQINENDEYSFVYTKQ